MTKKIYRTAQGKTIDMGTLRLKNEKVRAVGNMGVNARGDRIDAYGNVIDSKGQQLERRIQKQTNVSEVPVQTNISSIYADPIVADDIIGLDPVAEESKVKAPKVDINTATKQPKPKTTKDPKDLEDETDL